MNVEKYKNWSADNYDKVIDDRKVPLKLLAVLRPNANYWDILYISPRMVKEQKELHNQARKGLYFYMAERKRGLQIP